MYLIFSLELFMENNEYVLRYTHNYTYYGEFFNDEDKIT